jgi:stage II sporulation protein P
MTPKLFDVSKFMAADLTMSKTGGPKALIFHTHAREAYSDSRTGAAEDGVVGVGERLKETLENRYGIECLHLDESFDTVDGKSRITGAYERMEPVVERILRDNPSIEFAIDIHRDFLSDPLNKLLTEVNGKPAAKIMFVNGMSALYNSEGALEKIDGLSNPYIADNLAFSFRLQLAASKLYPDFTRKIYLKGYRYSLNMLPKSVLVEVGALSNTKEESLNAADALADVIAEVILP